MRLSCETAKWLVYAIVKRRFDMIATSDWSVTSYDLPPLRLLRAFLRWLVARAARPKP